MAATTESVKPAEEKTVTVTLAVENHVHRGQICKKGDKIDVPISTADWMRKNELIEVNK